MQIVFLTTKLRQIGNSQGILSLNRGEHDNLWSN